MACVEGNIYFAASQSSSFTPRPHIIVKCLPDGRVVYVYTTCQIAKVEAYCRRVEGIQSPSIDPVTMVVFNPSISPAFTDECAVNCNNAFIEDWSLFIASTRSGIIGNLSGTGKLDRLIEGIRASKVVSQKVISLL